MVRAGRGRSSAVEHGAYTAGVGGSNPSARTSRSAVTFAAFGTIAASLGLLVVMVREIARSGRDAAAVVGNALTLRTDTLVLSLT